MRRALSYIGSAVEFDEYRVHLKSVACPHCRAVGHLNRHGFLRGYAEEGAEREHRGWRVFCRRYCFQIANRRPEEHEEEHNE